MISLPFFRKKTPEKIGIQSGYDLWSSHYAEEKNPIKSASDQSVRDLLPDLAGKSLLDAGCGTGYFCQFAEQSGAKKITGIDFSEGMINQARKNCKKTHFITGEIQNIKLSTPVDILLCALVLGHLPDLAPVLRVFSQNLLAGGLLIVTDFHPHLSELGQKRTFKAGEKIFEIPHHIHTLDEYRIRLEENGFVIDEFNDIQWNDLPVIFALKARKT